MPDIQYERPQSLDAVKRLLAEGANQAQILAGGTDLGVKWRANLSRPKFLIDIKQVPELNVIDWSLAGQLRIGAAVTLHALYSDPKIAQYFPALTQGAEAVGSLQIRMRATLGGNLCNASPCMDTAPGLLVLGAKVEIQSLRGSRQIPLQDFFVGVKKTALAPDEFLAAVLLEPEAQKKRTAFDKIKRVRGHDLALTNAAVAFDPENLLLSAAVGSCGPTPIVNALRTPVKLNPQGIKTATEELAQMSASSVCPIDDVRASAEYRRDMAALLCRKLATKLLTTDIGRLT